MPGTPGDSRPVVCADWPNPYRRFTLARLSHFCYHLLVIMTPIRALNRKKSPNQHAYRVSVWGGSENIPGVSAEWVIYGSGVAAVVGRAIRTFRRGVAKKRRFSDWTVNVEPLRESETVIDAE